MLRGQCLPVFFISIWRWFTLDSRNGFFDLPLEISAPLVDLGGICPCVLQDIGFGNFQTVAPERRIFDLRINVTAIIVLSVSAEAKQICNDELRTFSGASSRGRFTEYLQAVAEFRGIDTVSLHAVADRPVHEIITGELPRRRRRIRILVIRHNEDQRQFFDRCLV